MKFGGARWPLGGPGWSSGAARGLPGGKRAQTETVFLAPWGGWGILPPF